MGNLSWFSNGGREVSQTEPCPVLDAGSDFEHVRSGSKPSSSPFFARPRALHTTLAGARPARGTR